MDKMAHVYLISIPKKLSIAFSKFLDKTSTLELVNKGDNAWPYLSHLKGCMRPIALPLTITSNETNVAHSIIQLV